MIFNKQWMGLLLAWLTLTASLSNAEEIYEFVRRIENPNGPAVGYKDHFGYSLDRVGENLLVGAYEEDTGANGTGSAYLFDPNGNLLTTFRNPTPLAGEFFGFAVHGLGDKVIIGAPTTGSPAVNPGAAYLFRSDGELLQTFTNPTPENSDRFGFSVTAVGDDVLIADPFDSERGERTGTAYLFDQQGEILRTFFLPNEIERNVFGYRVAALSEDIFAIHSGESIDGFEAAGAVYLYDIDGGDPMRIPNPDPVYRGLFGRSISLVGDDTILIGASYVGGTGAVFLYDLDGNLLHRIENPTPKDSGWFGRDTSAVSDDTFIVGALSDSTAGAGLVYQTGAAHLFNTDGELLQTILPPEMDLSTHFGYDFAVFDDRLFIGGMASGAGAVYEYHLVPEPSTWLLLGFGGIGIIVAARRKS